MKSRLLYATVVLALLAVAIPAVSQQPVWTYVNVQRVQVKADRVAEFLELAKQMTEPIKKAAPADVVRISCRTVVGNGNEFWLFNAMNKLADRDGENPLNKFSTPQERATRNARMGQTIERSMSFIERTNSDLMIINKGTSGTPAFIRYSRTRVRPGAANDFMNIYKTDIFPAVRKINGNVRIDQVVLGGNTNEFSFYHLFDKWAELDDNTAFQNAIGGDAGRKKLADKLDPIVVSNEQYILQVLPDLSYMPASAAPKR